MIHLLAAGALLAATLAAPAAEPTKATAAPAATAPAEKPAEKAAAPAEAQAKPAEKKPKPARKASKEALADARAALLGPCSPDMATGKLTKVTVLDGNALNLRIEKEDLELDRAHPNALFLEIGYKTQGGEDGTDFRQISTHFQLNTEQAQVLVGEKLCVFGKAP